ncbi:hypothetical protein LTR62_004909 [Meristemomyces frigidus]|uniref:Transcription factor domain-containing protein n=1 Tax=Meristemomyces frigidus TaxID=1508187 RepID=A0AAN7YJL2_9PEZI|nr:hypothetical protein LTR62_004909 [Meristemomyces frigidus]
MVRCDYMEGMGSDTESQHSPEQATLALTPETESRIHLWQETGIYPHPELQVFPQPRTHEYSRTELMLIHHLSTISNDLHLKATSHLTIWTQKLPKFLSIAALHPYVMSSLLSFSASHLAWVHNSSGARQLHLHYGSIALQGLHEAIGNFSPANADAILAASLLLLWQATDWRSWSSLRGGVQSILSTMHSMQHESLFTEYVASEDALAIAFRVPQRRPSINPNDRVGILQNAAYALQRLQNTLVGNEVELHYSSLLLAYIQQLQNAQPAQNPEDQFAYLYQLRKWLFWIPVALLQRDGGQGPALLTLAHFYASALALEPLFPDLGSSFCAATALTPLEAILAVTEAMQSQHGTSPAAMEIAASMQYPRQMAMEYKTRTMHLQSLPVHSPLPTQRPEQAMGRYVKMESQSPANIPYLPSQPQEAAATTSYLTPPNQSWEMSPQSWNPVPSPQFPPPSLQGYDDHMSNYGYTGFVQPSRSNALWT